jgi:hypothetical protein
MYRRTHTSLYASAGAVVTLIALVITTTYAQDESMAYPEVQVAQAQTRYAEEPTAQELVLAALKVTAANPKKAEQLAGRARASGWVPTVRLAVRRGMGAGLSAYQTLETDRTSLSSDDNLVLEASLTFSLDKLVYNGHEIAIAKEKSALEKARYELVRMVIALYFERRKLQIERDLEGRIEPKKAIRIAEIEALLDIFTNGEFKRMMRRKTKNAH